MGSETAGTDGMTSYEMEVGSGPMAVPMRVDWYPYWRWESDDGSPIIEKKYVEMDRGYMFIRAFWQSARSEKKEDPPHFP